ncbi:MAG: transglutaminase domain-containing protein [Bacteroidetes bacterium]|nr:transglutaminase domain-containing protein [Bacteroidota bacterium]
MSAATKSIALLDGSKGILTRETLPDGGDASVMATLGIMERLIIRDAQDERVRKIVAKYKGRTERETAKKLFDFMVANFKYAADPDDREHFTAPVHILTKNSPFPYRDCDDLAGAMAALLTAAGITNSLKVIAWRKTNPPGQYTHVYNEAILDGARVPMDLVMRSSGFNNEKKPIIRSHTWLIGSNVPLPASLQNGSALHDDLQYPDINWDGIGKDILTRALPAPFGKGENVGEILKQHMTAICVASVRQQLMANKDKIILAASAGAALFTTIGFVSAYALQKIRNNKRQAARTAKVRA